MRLGLALGLAAFAGCQDQGPRAEGGLIAEAERLVFVPAGEAQLPQFSGTFRARTPVALLVDRFEVRLADFDPEAEDPGERPATCDWAAANAFAAAAGMRLPTASEWMYVATGRLGRAYPWGQRRRSVANTLELGLMAPIAVGTFESGRGPFGTFDQIGNVWEWVADYVSGYELGIGAEAGLPEGAQPGLKSAMGGSYRTRLRPLFPAEGGPPVFAQGLTAGHLADDVGFRRVAEAEDWLREHVAELDPADEVARKRLQDLGADWYEYGEAQLVRLLQELLAELEGQPGSRALEALLAGTGR